MPEQTIQSAANEAVANHETEQADFKTALSRMDSESLKALYPALHKIANGGSGPERTEGGAWSAANGCFEESFARAEPLARLTMLFACEEELNKRGYKVWH